MDRNSFEYQIDGNTFLLRSDRSRDETDIIVAYVAGQIAEAKDSIKYQNKAMYSTLAALNIANQLYDLEKDHRNLQEMSKEPLENYEPLKNEYASYKEQHKESDQLISQLKDKISSLEKDLQHSNVEREKYKLELDRQQNLAQKSEKEVDDLRYKLLEQEKLTLQANKQVQEILRNR